MERLILGSMLLLIPLAAAHLDEGEDVVVNGYLIDLGWSPENPKAGEEAVIAINLVDDATQEVIEPESVWVRISNEGPVFSGTFHPEAQHVNFATTFPTGGDYELKVRFNGADGPLVEHTFTLSVAAGTLPYEVNEGGRTGMIIAIIFIIALLVVIAMQAIIQKNETHRKKRR